MSNKVIFNTQKVFIHQYFFEISIMCEVISRFLQVDFVCFFDAPLPTLAIKDQMTLCYQNSTNDFSMTMQHFSVRAIHGNNL